MLKHTFEIRVVSNNDKRYLKKHIYSYRHWQNILTIMVIQLFKDNNKDYKLFLDNRVISAVVAKTNGGKVSDKVEYLNSKYANHQMFNDLVEVGGNLKTHNLVEVIKRLKLNFSNYFLLLKDYKANPNKYTGMPKLPKAKKLSKTYNYSIPLDSYTSVSFKKKNYIGLNLSKKMRYFYIGNTDNIAIFKNNLKSVKVVLKNKEIFLQITYDSNSNSEIDNSSLTTQHSSLIKKFAGIDVGLNNLLSIFIDDKQTKSLIVDGKPFKSYNQRYNKKLAAIKEDIAKEVLEYKEVKQKNKKLFNKFKFSIDYNNSLLTLSNSKLITKHLKLIKYPIKWTKRGNELFRYTQFKTYKRNEYFEVNFNKIAKRVIEYLLNNQVTDLVLSRNLSELMNNGECKLMKKVKQNFIQIPFMRLIELLEYKATQRDIKVHIIDEAYTSKTSCITEDVCDVQVSNGYNKYNGSRDKGRYKDKTLNKVWHSDINGAVNHIKVATQKTMRWLIDYMWKLANPLKIKSAGELLNVVLSNSRSNRDRLSSYQTTARAYETLNIQTVI